VSNTPHIKGFRDNPKTTASGGLYAGRFTCHDVQWTKGPDNILATFTLTADELYDAARSELLWTDQDVQRGIQPGLEPKPQRELPLSRGYPNPKEYIFDSANADDIVEKLLRGDKLFLSSLIWNLRPGNFDAFWDEGNKNIYLYDGKVYLPDSHHRQQAIRKAVDVWRQKPTDYPRFSGNREFKVELYFLDKAGEGDYFFDKNQRPRPVAKSKAYDLTTQDDLSLLAKKFIDASKKLQGNVNRVTDRLSRKQPEVATLSTVREMMKAFALNESVDAPALDGMATVAAEFYDMLAEVRPELGKLSVADRNLCRDGKLVDAAVMMHGYAALMRDYGVIRPKLGTAEAKRVWQDKLTRLAVTEEYTVDGWYGELFSKQNPLWRRVGVVKPSRDGRSVTTLNTGAARSECGRILRQFLTIEVVPSDLGFLAGH
jgi:hypothetical protein